MLLLDTSFLLNVIDIHSVLLSMIRYDAAAGHVVLVECHRYSFSAASNDAGLLLLL